MLSQRFILVFEVLNSVGQVRPFNLSAFKVVDLGACLDNILLTETNETEVLIKVFLLA